MSVLMKLFRVDTPPGQELEVPTGMILLAYRGSIAHHMHCPSPDSIDDIDLIGFAVGEKKHYFGLEEWGSRGTKDFWHGRYDCVWYELRKAFALLLQGNPNIVSALWCRFAEYIHLSSEGRELLANRDLFVGKHVFNSFAGYAQAQLLKMQSTVPAEIREYLGVTYALKQRGAHPTDQNLPEDLGDHTDCSAWSTEKLLLRYKMFVKKGENLGYMGDKRKRLILKHGHDPKNLAHSIRLLRMCKEFLETGEMNVYRTHDAAELLDIKQGKWTLEQGRQHATELFEEIKIARDKSSLPEGPNREEAQKLLIRLVQSHLDRPER
jgi:predicted nucleotidyltransferase